MLVIPILGNNVADAVVRDAHDETDREPEVGGLLLHRKTDFNVRLAGGSHESGVADPQRVHSHPHVQCRMHEDFLS